MVKYIDFDVSSNQILEITLADYSYGDCLYINQFENEITIYTVDGIDLISFENEEAFLEYSSMSLEDMSECELRIGEIKTVDFTFERSA